MKYAIMDDTGNVALAGDQPFTGCIELDYDVEYAAGKFYKLGEAPAAPTETDLLFSSLRVARDVRIMAMSWLRERHMDELLLGKDTTLTEQQYYSVIEYIQALRDIPSLSGAPWDGGGINTPWPTVPEVK